VEFLLLRRELQRRVGPATLSRDLVIRLWAMATLAGAIAFGAERLLRSPNSIVQAAFVLGTFGVAYLLGTDLMGIPEAHEFTRRPFRSSASNEVKRGG
jgi:hypothetical protein